MSLTISASEFETLRSSNTDILMIDVRHPDEYLRESISESKNVPLTELTDAFADLDNTTVIVFICQSGMRSLKAVNFAQSIGFVNSKSLDGGINAWSKNDGA